MMKPKFDDVFEYVKAGEEDPKMREMLDLHPDGQELLKQARFICKMLQHQSESKDDGDTAADFGNVAAAPSQVAESPPVESRREMLRPMLGEERAFLRSKRTPSLSNLIEREGNSSEDLGTLNFASEGEQVALSFEPSKPATTRYRDPLTEYFVTPADMKGIVIRGNGIDMFLPKILPAADPMSIRVTSGARQMPTRGIECIFMPESGPFVRMRANIDGLVELPAPNQPGTLRIETPIPQLLRIQPKE